MTLKIYGKNIEQKNIQREFKIIIAANDDPSEQGDPVVFLVHENGESREMGSNNVVIYDVKIDPHNDTPFVDTTDLINSADWGGRSISEELIIAANVWHYAGWTHLDDQLAKKWPPRCERKGANQYRVTIEYDQLFVVNFQISQLKARKKVSDRVSVWTRNGSSYDPVDLSKLGDLDKMGYFNIGSSTKANKVIVEGVDVVDPQFTWTERWTYGPIKSLNGGSSGDFEKRYDNVITKLTGTVNKDKFREFPELSVMYGGGVGRNTSPLAWEFDHKFTYRPEKEFHTIGGVQVLPKGDFKSGWAFLDIKDTDDREGENATFEAVIDPVKIHLVLEKGDFSDLNVGGEIPFGYGTPFDEKFMKTKIPTIGEEWILPVWAVRENI